MSSCKRFQCFWHKLHSSTISTSTQISIRNASFEILLRVGTFQFQQLYSRDLCLYFWRVYLFRIDSMSAHSSDATILQNKQADLNKRNFIYFSGQVTFCSFVVCWKLFSFPILKHNFIKKNIGKRFLQVCTWDAIIKYRHWKCLQQPPIIAW